MDSIERRLADAKLGAAIDDAADSLPDGFSLEVTIHNGCFDVGATNRNSGIMCNYLIAVREPFEGGRASLSDCIRQGLDWAREKDGGE